MLKVMTWASAVGFVLLMTGCANIPVDSKPQGAFVIMDGRNTGKVTPAKLYIGSELTEGSHLITVEKEGYCTATPPWELEMEFHPVAAVFCTLLCPPMGIAMIFDTHWKGPTRQSFKAKPPFFILEQKTDLTNVPN